MYHLLKTEKAEASVVGHIIILALTITGIAMIMLFALPVIGGMQNMVSIKNVEQIFTMIDSRANRALLGSSPFEAVDVSLGDGVLAVKPNNADSYMIVKSQNDTFNITVSMGKLTYRLGDRVVAYEGGGIWSKYPSGGSVMLSPPEFHYNGVTLTIPEINISGNGSAGGRGNAEVSFTKKEAKILFPNASRNMTNPLDISIHGKVYVYIRSDFYDAWAEYAKSLIYTTVSTNPANRTAIIELSVVPSTLGSDTQIFNPIVMRGIPGSDEPLDNFSLKIQPGSSNLMWDIRSSSGTRRLIIYFKDVNNWVETKKIDVSVGYQDDGHGYSQPAEVWVGDEIITIDSDKFAYIDLLNSSINMTYAKDTVGSVNSQYCQPFGGKINAGDVNTSGGFSWNRTYYPGNTTSLRRVIQHYISIAAQDDDIYFYQCSPSNSGGKAPDADSTMLINYKAKGALTYMHISETTSDVSVR